MLYKVSDGRGQHCPDGRFGIGGARRQAALDLGGVGVKRVQIGGRQRRSHILVSTLRNGAGCIVVHNNHVFSGIGFWSPA